MLAVSVIVLSVSCGHYSLLPELPDPESAVAIAVAATPLLKMQNLTAVLLMCSHGSLYKPKP